MARLAGLALPVALLLAAAATVTRGAAAGVSPSNSVFGRQLRPLFAFDATLVNLNHGSYGAPPRSVLDARQGYLMEMEASTDLWFRYHVYGRVDSVRSKVAAYINASDPADLVFVDNASHGVNAVLRSLRLGMAKADGLAPQDAKILYLSTAYAMVKNTIEYVDGINAEGSVVVNVTYPTSAAAIVAAVTAVVDAAENAGRIKLASFSHISSVPGFVLPVKELVSVVKSRGIMVLIDGAHAPGQIPVDVEDIGADFYVANAHKWMYSAKGSAFLWVAPDKQHLVVPPTISREGQGATQFQEDFSYQGTDDYSAKLAIADALEFRAGYGEAAIMGYMHALAIEGGQKLVSMWNSSLLIPPEMTGAMVNVGLPPCGNTTTLSNLGTTLIMQHNTWVPPFSEVYGGELRWYVRVSAQIYNDLTDFEYLGKAVLEIFSEPGAC